MAEASDWQGAMGRTWAALHESTDRQFAGVTEIALGTLDARPGERVLDLGCGAGTTTLHIASAVAPGGGATGIDISPDLTATARRRAAEVPEPARPDFVLADAAAHDFGGARFDALFSRHGCMFFADPAAAYARLRATLAPGARVVMTCFGPMAANAWATVPGAVAEAVLGPAPPPSGPGPFAWADPDAFRGPLSAAGFRDIAWEARDVTFAIGRGDAPEPVERAIALIESIGVVARRLRTAPEGAADRLRPALAEALAPHVRDGWVRLGARIWLVTARA